MVQGSAELTQADAIAKINQANQIISSEKEVFKSAGKFASGAKFLGGFFGVVSLADHSAKAWSCFSNGDKVNGWINIGKIAVDAVLIGYKLNPVGMTLSVGYGILDTSGYLDYKK
jgi:hypothetical protein